MSEQISKTENAANSKELDKAWPSFQTFTGGGFASSGRALLFFRAMVVFIFVAAFVVYMLKSAHWAMMIDSPVIHYVNFLMAHGLRPYVEITDMNMPGTYLLDALQMRLFGPGDVALRLYAFVLALVLVAAMMVITRRQDWLAGFYAGSFFVLLQAAEGPKTAVEREQVLVTLMVVACAFLFESVRRQRPSLALFFGAFAGMAVTIKPTAVFLPVLWTVFMGVELRRRGRRYSSFVIFSLVGMALAASTSVFFLWRYDAFGGFLQMLRVQMPSYVSMNRPPFGDMVRTLLPIPVLIPLAFAAATYVIRRRTRAPWTWEQTMLLLGVLAGIASYFAQNKGFLHHRYLFLCFLLLLIGLELTTALRSLAAARFVAAAGLAVTVLLVVPRYVVFVAKASPNSEYTVALENDLSSLQAGNLQHRVVCLDLVFGCLNSLYHLGLVENVGYTGDLLLFSPRETEGVRFYRRDFMEKQQLHPADVLVVSNEWLEHPNTFSRLDTWPAFEKYLAENYRLQLEREFPGDLPGSKAETHIINGDPPAYRLYLRNPVVHGVRPGTSSSP